MSEASSSTSYVDVNSDVWQEYFGETKALTDILKMTESEWETYVNQLGTDASQFFSDLEAEISDRDFETLIGGTLHDLKEINTDGEYDSLISELQALYDNCDLEPLEDAISTYNLANVDLREQGATYTFTEDPDVTAGTVYAYEYAESMDLETFYMDLEEGTTIELASYDDSTGDYIFRCTNEDGVIFYLKFVKGESTTTSSGRSEFDPHPDWPDMDGDGYGDTPLEYDENGNLMTDLNEDGVVNQADVEIAEGHKGFDFVMTGADGNITEAEINSWRTEIAEHFFQSSAAQTSGMSLYNAVNGIDPSSSTDFETYYLNNYGSTNSVDIDLSTNTATNITIECESGVADTINITNLPSDAQFSVNSEGWLIITCPSTGQTITIKNWEAGIEAADQINITGAGLTSDISSSLHHTSSGGSTQHSWGQQVPSSTDYTDVYADCVSSIIFVNGSSNSSDLDYWNDNMKDDYTVQNTSTA